MSGDAEVDGVVAALSDIAEGNYGEASNAWQALCERDPGNGMYRQNLAICLLYAGRMEEVCIPIGTPTWVKGIADIDSRPALCWKA